MNEVIITLKNGRVLNATMVQEGLYQATLRSGKVKFYPIDSLIRVEVATGPLSGVAIVNQTEEKKENQMVFHYMVQETVGDVKVMRRFITNTMPMSILDRYQESIKTHQPVNGIFAITTGDWHFSLLEWRLIARGRSFAMMIINDDDMAAFRPSEIEEWVDKSVFAYANASYSFFLKMLDGSTDWGLHHAGLELDFAKKSAKRAQEIARITEMALCLEDDEDFSWEISDKMDKMPASYGDGVSFMTKAAAIRVARTISNNTRRGHMIHNIRIGKAVRFTIRMLCAGGLIKGDVILVDSLPGGKDLVIHPDNLKTELRMTDNSLLLSIWEHHTIHMATWDSQSTVNFDKALPESKQIADVNLMVKNMKSDLEAGNLPDWIMPGAEAHNDDGTPNLEKLSSTMHLQWTNWYVNTGEVTSGQNLVAMGFGGVRNRMTASETVKYKGQMLYRKMFIPMTNAVSAAIVSTQACVVMGGIDFPSRRGNQVFFDARVGLVIPGYRFEETKDLHGGMDQDDNMKVIMIKAWASGNVDHLRGNAIPRDMDVPTLAEDASVRGLLLRSPNGPGEWSVENVDFRNMFNEFPAMLDETQVVTVDLSEMPLPQHMAKELSTFHGLPESTVYTHELMTREDAKEMIFAQLKNPGVEKFCNAMIAYASVAPGFPAEMLDIMESIVDACQQGFDRAQFTLINLETDNIFKQLCAYLESHEEVSMDAGIAATRMPKVWMNRILDRLVDGRAMRVQRVYSAAIHELDSMVKGFSMKWRRESKLVQELKANHPIEASWGRFSLNFFDHFHYRLKAVDTQHRVPTKADPFTKMSVQFNHKVAMEALVAEMVKVFTDIQDDDTRYTAIIGLYKWIVLAPQAHLLGRPEVDLGRVDRIIFQSGGKDKLSLMHILIEALHYRGIIGQ